MKQPRQQWVIDYTCQDHDDYVRLAHHVIWRATADLWSKEKKLWESGRAGIPPCSRQRGEQCVGRVSEIGRF